jgi:hypothetical protein
VLDDPDGFGSWTGTIDGDTSSIYVAQSGGDAWKLTQDGTRLGRTEVLGWSSAFTGAGSGDISLRFETPPTRWLMLLGQVLAWVLVITYLLRVRVRVDESGLLPATDPGQVSGDRPPATTPGSLNRLSRSPTVQIRRSLVGSPPIPIWASRPPPR